MLTARQGAKIGMLLYRDFERSALEKLVAMAYQKYMVNLFLGLFPFAACVLIFDIFIIYCPCFLIQPWHILFAWVNSKVASSKQLYLNMLITKAGGNCIFPLRSFSIVVGLFCQNKFIYAFLLANNMLRIIVPLDSITKLLLSNVSNL